MVFSLYVFINMGQGLGCIRASITKQGGFCTKTCADRPERWCLHWAVRDRRWHTGTGRWEQWDNLDQLSRWSSGIVVTQATVWWAFRPYCKKWAWGRIITFRLPWGEGREKKYSMRCSTCKCLSVVMVLIGALMLFDFDKASSYSSFWKRSSMCR